jgi:hypothetical protein
VTLTPGADTLAVVVNAIDDAVAEANKGVKVSLGSGAWQSGRATLWLSCRDNDQRAALAAPGTPAGLRYRAYTGLWSRLPDFSTLTAERTGTASTVSVAPRPVADGFGLRFDGFLEVPSAGAWTLTLISDDGSRLWIGDEPVITNDGVHTVLERSATIRLDAGHHPLRIDYFDATGPETLRLRWQPEGGTAAPVPATALFQPIPTDPG